MILMLMVSSISAGSFKVGNAASRANFKTVETANQNGERSAIIVKKTNTASAQLTGTYHYKSGNYNNTISVEEQGNNRLRVELNASYEYKINGEWNANVGEAKGIVTLDGNTAVLVPKDREDCKFVLKFSGSKIIVKQESKSNCGFGLNAYAGGTYRKVNNKPDFSESDENSTSEQNPTTETKNEPSGLTGTYRYKSGNNNNAISVEEKSNNRLRVSIVVNYEYKVDGEWMVNSGSAGEIVALKGDTTILVPADFTDCQISLKFSANKIVVKQKGTVSDCGFGANTRADGIYVKTSNELNANVMDDDAQPLPDEISSERVNFKRGKSAANVLGKIAKGEEKVYLIGARSGQTMEVVITYGGKYNDVVFHIVAPDGSLLMGMAGEELAEINSGWKGKLTKTGDYKIVVGVIEAEKADFKMSVSIR